MGGSKIHWQCRSQARINGEGCGTTFRSRSRVVYHYAISPVRLTGVSTWICNLCEGAPTPVSCMISQKVGDPAISSSGLYINMNDNFFQSSSVLDSRDCEEKGETRSKWVFFSNLSFGVQCHPSNGSANVKIQTEMLIKISDRIVMGCEWVMPDFDNDPAFWLSVLKAIIGLP